MEITNKDGCIFCAIAKGESPATIEFQNDNIMAFRDLNPEAPIHVLVIPKRHISGMSNTQASDINVLGEILLVAKDLAQKLNIAENGYRLVINQGLHSGQIVEHLHLHLLGGCVLGKIADCQ